jgi:hypothetical protein
MNTISRAEMQAKRARLAAEIKDAEGKFFRLREALEVRRRNLSRLDAALAMNAGEARGPRHHE